MRPIMKDLAESRVKDLADLWYWNRRAATVAEGNIRRAVALLTQVREELMCDEVRSFLHGIKGDSGMVASKTGMLRLTLQLELRGRGLQEKLRDESLAGIMRSQHAH